MNIVSDNNLDIDTIITSLEQGSVIVYPTETSYGLGCDATNQVSVNRIFDIKKRDHKKALLVIAPNIEMMMDYVYWNETLDRIAHTYWPGPLTVVVKAKPDTNIAKGVLAEDNTIAFRITNHPFASALATKLAAPLVSTSANITGKSTPYDITSVKDMFEKEDVTPDIVIDAGNLPHKIPSTIIRVVGDYVDVLRQGEIIIEYI
ncbi:MAG: threonylcarbamoyl-AMP synthase [Candidatus Magasanikbacteria bacterium]|jgi:L-threonylcarbamoyladenylate synthase|nr:threonylcarbamoyl-AMP synthase [Candidatus Magasanikbacteria bacterium]MBT4220861.1 threonylcarbamoyl-AMP synthase [Candidatus Magasanikbacteria bacterium]MBT4350866.1 threonylcarbamoyl-AMP synthase [Candidatus Magasanikbacteria bacterium]MBT4541792.1 threonylcarbamoyl-AMP synthase [Candidatus Magasanikbacteria bacterium]MBT6253552.1 threonylcarbamoyl-AMP synthase [Candidatus Magasanikbacteria bacterium]